MQINIQKLAKLAKLAITEQEAASFEQALNRLSPIIDHINTVQTQVEPLQHPLDQTLVLRPDIISEKNERGAYQASAPSSKDGYYLVPQVIES